MPNLLNAKIIEIVTFTLNEGVSHEQFAPLDKAVEEQHVSKQPGFIARQAAMGEDGTWLVIVYWASVDAAEASMASFMDAPAAGEFMANLNANTMSMTRYSIAQT